MKDKLGTDAVEQGLSAIKTHLAWLDDHDSNSTEKEEFDEQKKKAEGELGPLFMKLYGSGADSGPGADGAEKEPPFVPTESGPKVEEVD